MKLFGTSEGLIPRGLPRLTEPDYDRIPPLLAAGVQLGLSKNVYSGRTKIDSFCRIKDTHGCDEIESLT